MLNVKQRSCEYQFLVFGLIRPRIEPKSTVSVANVLSTQPLLDSSLIKCCAALGYFPAKSYKR